MTKLLMNLPLPPLFPLSSSKCTCYAHTSLAHTYMVVTMHTHKLAYLRPMHSTQLYHWHTLRAHAFSLCMLNSLDVCYLQLLTFPYVPCYVYIRSDTKYIANVK